LPVDSGSPFPSTSGVIDAFVSSFAAVASAVRAAMSWWAIFAVVNSTIDFDSFCDKKLKNSASSSLA
jgi:hypothetical protein